MADLSSLALAFRAWRPTQGFEPSGFIVVVTIGEAAAPFRAVVKGVQPPGWMMSGNSHSGYLSVGIRHGGAPRDPAFSEALTIEGLGALYSEADPFTREILPAAVQGRLNGFTAEVKALLALKPNTIIGDVQRASEKWSCVLTEPVTP